MANQTGANTQVVINAEDTTGVEATATGAQRLRIIDSPGLALRQAQVLSREKTDAAVQAMGRLGAKSVDGSYNCELTVGGAVDELVEAIMRSTWTAAVAITQTEMTSITTTASTIVAAGGSWITEGVREGDVVRLTNHATTANNDINLRVLTVTATTITVVGTPLTTDASPDSTFTLTILKKVVTNTSGPTRRTFTVEQYEEDNDLSQTFLGCRVVGMRLSFRPGQMAQVTFTLMGLDRNAKGTGASPFFTSPTVTTGLALVPDDSQIIYNGSAITSLTGFDLNFQITARGEPVIGSLVSPDVFDNDLSVTGQVTGIRQDFSNLTLYDAETEFAMGIMLEASGSAPVDTFNFYLPRVKLASVDAPAGGGDGALVESMEVWAAKHAGSSTVDETVCTIQSSAA